MTMPGTRSKHGFGDTSFAANVAVHPLKATKTMATENV
jgi:hypothetical protein